MSAVTGRKRSLGRKTVRSFLSGEEIGEETIGIDGMLERKEQAWGTVRLKLAAEKKVILLDTNNSNFLFACFPFADFTSFVSFPS